MKRYTISCETCGSFQQGIVYPGERIRHTHEWIGPFPSGRIVVTVTS